MIALTMAATGLGFAALICAWQAITPPAPPLQRRLEILHQPPTPPVAQLQARWRHWALTALGLTVTEFKTLDQNLAVCDETRDHHAATKLSLALAGISAPILAGVALRLAGVDLVVGGVALLAGLLGAGGYLLPDVGLRARAQTRRRHFRYALNLFLELVVIAVEGGAGVHEALRKAAQAGSGWAFQALRRALTTAYLEADSPWKALRQLGERLGSTELVELASAVELAATRGAPPQDSLRAKAATVRDHELNDLRADAISASTRMGGPMVGLFVGFLLLIGYPAVVQILGL